MSVKVLTKKNKTKVLVQSRVAFEEKEQLENLLGKYGISISDYLRICVKVALLNGGVPFDLRQKSHIQSKSFSQEEKTEVLNSIKLSQKIGKKWLKENGLDLQNLTEDQLQEIVENV